MPLCHSCGAEVDPAYRFCAVCGTALPIPGPDELTSEPDGEVTGEKTGDVAKTTSLTLTVIGKGGEEGPSFTLSNDPGSQHVVGRTEGDLPFPDDPQISPRHALLYWEGNTLWLEDMASLNGVYLRVHDSEALEDGDLFLAGEQLMRFEMFRLEDRNRQVGECYFSGTPLEPWTFRLVHLIEHSQEGAAWVAEGAELAIGRERGRVRFPHDPYMSRDHCRVRNDGRSVRLFDSHSRNGTYLRISERQAVTDSDYFFVGQTLFRVSFH
jgi:pSer/pThr/pTyr-binding forkhead associated (FHA) protein